jgi:hypothetical protein
MFEDDDRYPPVLCLIAVLVLSAMLWAMAAWILYVAFKLILG